MSRVVEQDGEVARNLIAYDDVGAVRSAPIGDRNAGRPRANGSSQGDERAVRLLQSNGDAIVEIVDHHQVVEVVAGEVGGKDANRKTAGGKSGAAPAGLRG